MNSTKEKQFQILCRNAHTCRICPDLAEKTAVLSELNGNIDPKVMFIAEAPGRQGADRTRIPFSGDKSGKNLQVLLDSIGLTRREIFITNAVLCSPRKESGANRKPTRKEIKNCTGFLEKTIDLIDPKIIVTLGGVALEALSAIEYHQIKLKADAAKILQWNDRLLIPLYHPSPQVIASHRRLNEQLQDFQSVARAINQTKFGKREVL